MKPVKLSELIDCLEMESEERVEYVDLQEGRVVSVEDWILRALEEEDEDVLADVPGWQKAEVEDARAIAKDTGERFVGAPDKFDFHEYRHMERFIQTVENKEEAEQLWRVIKGKGAFRYFKDTAARLGLLVRWYAYRSEAMKEHAEDWAKANQVPYVDDLKDRSAKG
jgi:hypothetical protein